VGNDRAADAATSNDGLKARVAAANGVDSALRATWVTLLSLVTYLFVAVGSTTHRDLLLEKAQKMPILGIDLPLITFYAWAPVLLLVIHGYFLVQFYSLSLRLRVLEVYINDGGKPGQTSSQDEIDKRRRLAQTGLDSSVILQYLAGHSMSFVRPRAMTGLVMLSTSVAAPLLLLLSFQITFLPYHSELMVTWHRAAFLLDVGLLLYMWPRLPRAGTARAPSFSDLQSIGTAYRSALRTFAPWPAALRYPLAVASEIVVVGRTILVAGHWLARFAWTHLKLAIIIFIVSMLSYFSIAVATFPGEMAERLGTRACPQAYADFYGLESDRRPNWEPCLTALLFDGPVDYGRGQMRSPFSRNLVLPGLDLVDATDEEVKKRVAERQYYYNLVGRDLSHGVIIAGDLRGIRFDGANLSKADLSGTRLKYSSFACVDKNGNKKTDPGECVRLDAARLGLVGTEPTDLTGANVTHTSFQAAQMDGTIFREADATDADFLYATGSPDFTEAHLQDADLRYAVLFPARFRPAQAGGVDLSGAVLGDTDARGTEFVNARMAGTVLDGVFIGTDFSFVEAPGASLSGRFEATSFRNARLIGANFYDRGSLTAVRFDCADLEGARLEASSQVVALENALVWRSVLPPSDSARRRDLATAVISGFHTAAGPERRVLVRPQEGNPSCVHDPAEGTAFEKANRTLQQIVSEFKPEYLSRPLAGAFNARMAASFDRIKILHPNAPNPPGWKETDLTTQTWWDDVAKKAQSSEDAEPGPFCQLVSTACRPRPRAEPYAAAGLIRYRMLRNDLALFLGTFQNALKDPEFCPNAVGLASTDMARLAAQVAAWPMPPENVAQPEYNYLMYKDCVGAKERAK
jgi:uncharacterized protein YjbI with pentapeptide repeats